MRTDTQLPVWFRGKSALKLELAAKDYWEHIEAALYGWLNQIDEQEAAEAILDLLAWERDINRIQGEPLDLYAQRVKHAVANAQDAGFNLGMERIFRRLGFGFIEINDRVPGFDWDMVEIAMLESEMHDKQGLIKEVIRSYGRTCRRYFLSALAAVETYEAIGLVDFNKEVVQ